MGWLIFDGISVLYVLTLFLLLIILMAIFVQRQILRLRNNSARQRPNVSLRPISKKSCAGIEQMLEAVGKMRKSYLPRLTDCTTIGQHSNAPYVHRMIAVDEITLEIDVQLARINPELARQAGESTLAYLTRVRTKMPSLPIPLIQKIAYMHEAARFRPQARCFLTATASNFFNDREPRVVLLLVKHPQHSYLRKFELKHLMELRSLLNQFVKIIADAPVVGEATPASPAKGILHHLGQKTLSNKKRQSKFGGSDGGRLLAGAINEERISLLPTGGNRLEASTRLRRQSDSHRSLLD